MPDEEAGTGPDHFGWDEPAPRVSAERRRLEEGGFVRRVRDPHDRRRVIVELGGGPGLREIGPTFGPVVKAWRATAAGYSDDELRLLLEFQGKLEEIMRGQLARLRGDDTTPPATT